MIECTGRLECMKIAIYAAKPGSKVVLVGLGQRDKMYELPITHAAVSFKLHYYFERFTSKVNGLKRSKSFAAKCFAKTFWSFIFNPWTVYG